MEIRRVATLILYDSQRRVLLQNREGISKSGEKWGFFGGGVEDGETPRQALVREIREELSYEVQQGDFLGVYEGVTGSGVHLTNYVYIAKEPIFACFRQSEGNGMRYFPIQDTVELNMNGLDHDVLENAAIYIQKQREEQN